MSWSGGKDSTLALDRAVRQGLDVRYLMNIYEGNSGRVRFHGVPADLIRVQAERLGLEIVQTHTHPADFETVFLDSVDALRSRGVGGIIFGNIHLQGVREWYEERTTGHGLEHYEPLWGEDPAALVSEFLDRGFRTRITAVDLERGRRAWVGRVLDAELAGAIATAEGVDPAGEHGEYHTFTFGGPLFREDVVVRTGDLLEMDGHGVIDLELAPDAGHDTDVAPA